VKRFAPLVALLLLAGLVGCPGSSGTSSAPAPADTHKEGDGHDHGKAEPGHKDGDGHDHGKAEPGHKDGDGHDHGAKH
jgi:hypothetical protein